MNRDEKELLKRLVSGDKRALEEFYKKTRPKLMGWVISRVKCRQDAEELVQDVYLAFLDSLPLFRGKSTLYTFLVSITRHEVADYWRKRYAKKAILTVPFMDQVYTEKLYSSVQMAMVIEKVYRQILPEQAGILRMKYEEGLSVRQIAYDLGMSVKAAESRLFRARRAFRVVYEVVDSD